MGFLLEIAHSFHSCSCDRRVLNHFIDKLLGHVEVVAVMLVLGGIFMLFCDKLFNKGTEETELTEREP